jgi:single-strand DNA-binding protein
MNKIMLLGRICKDLELKQNGETSVVKFTLAVNRRGSKESQQQADFISCVAFNKTAITMCNFLEKGRQIGLEGRLQTGDYINREGVKVYTTEVIVDCFYFADSKKSQGEPEVNIPSWDDIPAFGDGSKDDLPF